MPSAVLTGIALYGGYNVNVEEWKKTQLQKHTSQYTHFDPRVSLKSCLGYISSPQKVCHHGFYPFIHYTIKNRKVKKGKSVAPKKREIYYAAHLDSWIYRYYAYLINEKYNLRVKEIGIDNVAIAYRTDLKKNNIDFSKRAFQFIRSIGPCYVMIGDFTNFFDNLDHAYLKERLCDLLAVDRLTDDWYAVYKNVTRFSYVELKDLLELNGLEDTREGRREFNKRSRKRALSTKLFRANKGIVHANPNCKYGVPQGSPISAALANVYMLIADKQIHEYTSSLGGMYMRYSDDFIVIIPDTEAGEDGKDHYNIIKEILSLVPNLVFEASKTNIFYCSNQTVTNCTNQFIEQEKQGKNIIEFLGFSFDGKCVRIRDKTISKYYNKLYRKLRTIINNQGYSSQNKRISGKNLYKKYSYKGSRRYQKTLAKKEERPIEEKLGYGNFFDYVAEAKEKFGEETVAIVMRRHMQKIRKQLDLIPELK